MDQNATPPKKEWFSIKSVLAPLRRAERGPDPRRPTADDEHVHHSECGTSGLGP